MSNFWRCSACSSDNVSTDAFCKRCGGRSNFSSSDVSGVATPIEATPRKGRVGLWIALILIFCVAAGSAGYYFWNKQKEKKDAQAYIQEEGTAFGVVLTSVNGLSTEKNVTDSGVKGSDGIDVFLKKVEDEAAKSEQALALIRTTKSGTESILFSRDFIRRSRDKWTNIADM